MTFVLVAATVAALAVLFLSIRWARESKRTLAEIKRQEKAARAAVHAKLAQYGASADAYDSVVDQLTATRKPAGMLTVICTECGQAVDTKGIAQGEIGGSISVAHAFECGKP
jgi:hypothetical protein